jgi:hypothetical protein
MPDEKIEQRIQADAKQRVPTADDQVDRRLPERVALGKGWKRGGHGKE